MSWPLRSPASPLLTRAHRPNRIGTRKRTLCRGRSISSMRTRKWDLMPDMARNRYVYVTNKQKIINFKKFSGSSQDISSLVTIVTKTFQRYNHLKNLINSIQQYNPNVTIVFADGNENPRQVTGPHIEQYIMSFRKCLFVGRNLALSQVTTKYVVCVDDYSIFTADTKLEKMVDILERTSLDLVGSAVREVTGWTSTCRHTISVEEGGEHNDCLHIMSGYHHAIERFPFCVDTDQIAVINFFMARTEKVQQVGFNPHLARPGSLEFFVDGLGSLHIGSCSDVVINHASKIQLPWTRTTSKKAYLKFRYSQSNDVIYISMKFCTSQTGSNA
ncbi:LOW QUALITY PROTEIN: beta-1,4 N-acetylgalactosaminyltransferase 1a [Corythoichthys intestinalis]|uniref:LOW QUALITY PROTEIN: beta-1,4 N-acetylgalactosaminyltransferase 1a n=1 Tax=Corythoichthys intestinalis TaxID=161448 RepID=UPI0025A682F7|nr:LOW QUALITY PROTEIN: beta-1,4 N-acetylgalactosaminyltransferase 1a [Corythoichthys intestinalis]